MAGYTKTVWTDRVVQYPNRYKDQSDTQYTFTRDEGTITEAGTPIIASNMNNHEQAIYERAMLYNDAITDTTQFPTFTGTDITTLEHKLTASPYTVIRTDDISYNDLDQLNTNGSFETGVTDYSTEYGTAGTLATDTVNYKFGTQSAKLTLASSSNFRGKAITCTNGHIYYLACWCKSSDGVLSGKPAIRTSGATYISGDAIIATSFTLSSERFTADGTEAYIGFFTGTGNGSYVNYDGLILIDLTDAYGTGNEPTQSQMDDFYTKLGYYDGTAQQIIEIRTLNTAETITITYNLDEENKFVSMEVK